MLNYFANLARAEGRKYHAPALIQTKRQRRVAAIARRRRKKADVFFNAEKSRAADRVGRWLFGGGR